MKQCMICIFLSYAINSCKTTAPIDIKKPNEPSAINPNNKQLTKKRYINDNQVNFRQGPHPKAKVFKQLSKGTEVELIELQPDLVKVGKWQGHWAYIRTEDGGGWVLDSFIANNITDINMIDGDFEGVAKKYSDDISCCKDHSFLMYSAKFYKNSDEGTSWREPAILSINMQANVVSIGYTYIECNATIIEITKLQPTTFIIKGTPGFCTLGSGKGFSLKLQLSDDSATVTYSDIDGVQREIGGKYFYGEPSEKRIFDR